MLGSNEECECDKTSDLISVDNTIASDLTRAVVWSHGVKIMGVYIETLDEERSPRKEIKKDIRPSDGL